MNLGTVLALLAFTALVGFGAYVAGARWARVHAAAELASRLRELFLLQEISYFVSESLNLGPVVEQIARYLVRFLDAQGTVIMLIQEGEGVLRVAAAEGSLARLAGRSFAIEEAGLLSAAIARQKLEVTDGPTPTELLAGIEIRRAAVAPLRARAVTTGVIAAVDPPEPFSPGQLRLLATVAAHAAVVLINARLFDLVRAGKEQWESTFDALPDGIAVVDEAGVIRRANRALAQMLDRPLPTVIGRNLAQELFGTASELAALYQAAGQGERVAPITRPSETLRRVFRISVAPMQGTESGGWAVALIEDVTEQRAFEAQMIQHEKMAAVGQLVSGVAHELNNPLTSIAGLADLLLEQQTIAPRTKEHLRVIHEQAERAGKIVRNLLTFSRQGPAEIVPLDVSDVVQRTSLLLEYEMRLQQVELVTELPADAVVVHADRMQLQQVVVNLLANAVQAVATNPPDRPRRVIVRTGRRGERAFVEVEDTGPGIPDELVSNVFTPFFTTKEPGKGTGLGLAISYGIVERHGGTMRQGRAPAGGALFVAELPLASGEAHPAERASGAQMAPASPDRPGLHLLLVDDDPAVRQAISGLFSSDGHRVETARDGAHAMELLEHGSYDVVVADPRAAAGPGATFAETLLARWPDLKRWTIFATADVRPETEEWLRKLGCRYVHKPITARQLRLAVADLLRS